jgi:23S rRNA (adenine2503-C2)-methyltransferase
MIAILSYTLKEYVDKICTSLGKGSRHAALIYTTWMKEGIKLPLERIEPQAALLVQKILEITDFSLPLEVGFKEEEETKKFLLKDATGLEIETVAIPMKAGVTLCLSSQVGCRMGCAFCETGRMGLLKNLSVVEIVAQVFIARFYHNIPVRNIVFMGMGEPLDNFNTLIQAIRVLTDSSGLHFGPSRITVSTSGDVDQIYLFMQSVPVALNLAVSVNAPNDLIRNRLMPINKRWNMQALKEAMIAYCSHPRRQILAEYVLMKDINDSVDCADELAAYLKGLRVKVNLIAYNAQSKSRFAPPEFGVQESFRLRLQQHGYQVLLRSHKGRGIMAACGQLGNIKLRRKLRVI